MAHNLRRYVDSYLVLASQAGVPPLETYRPVLQWKGAVLVRQMRWANIPNDVPARDHMDNYESICRRLAHTWRAMPGPNYRQTWHDAMEKLTHDKEAMEIELTKNSDAFRRQWELRRLSPEGLQAALPAGTALIDFLEYSHFTVPTHGKGKLTFERRLVAFVVRRDRPLVRAYLGPAAPVAAAIECWRKAHGADTARGKELRCRLWEPLEEYLKDVKTVLVSPDGILARMPFGALPGKKPGTYLIEERAVAVIPVPQLLREVLNTDDSAKSEPSLLLLGDIQFDAMPGQPEAMINGKTEISPTTRSVPRGGKLDAMLQILRPLPGTQVEVTAIKDLFQRKSPKGVCTDLREAEATEGAFRKEGPRHRFLHLATHGFFMPAEITAPSARAETRNDSLFRHREVTGLHPGLLSGLVLAGAKQSPDASRDDGILTALEISALDLSKVELAVLSACDTGLGEVAGGEGVLGLQRAFQTAGAKSVVATLWQVRDDAARALMVDFYRNILRHNMPKAAALQQAQCTMLRNGIERGLVSVEEGKPKPTHTPPQYWAGFVLSGDWR